MLMHNLGLLPFMQFPFHLKGYFITFRKCCLVVLVSQCYYWQKPAKVALDSHPGHLLQQLPLILCCNVTQQQ